MLPDKSTISIKNGAWFIHHDGKNSIKIYCSNLCKEKVYLNEKLISEKRSLKTNNKHLFEDENKVNYRVEFGAANLQKGMECYIYREEELIKVFRTRLISDTENTKRDPILYLPMFISALVIELFEFSRFYYLIPFALLLIFHYRKNKIGKMVIEEENIMMVKDT